MIPPQEGQLLTHARGPARCRILCMKRLFILAQLFTLAEHNAGAQAQFEAASVKRTNECAFENSITTATVSLKGDPLMPILVEAFKIPKEQIAGPAWLNEDCFEIFGKPPEGSTKDQIAAMFQALLAERFKLAVHMEERTRDVYALVVDKNGPKVKASVPGAFVRGQTGQPLFREPLRV